MAYRNQLSLLGAVLAIAATSACSDADSSNSASAAADDGGAGAAHYEITIPADDHRVALVSASLIPDDAVFYMFPGGNQLPRRWSTFVSGLEVRDSDGQTIPVVANEDGSWQLKSVPEGPVSISYQVSLDHEDHAWSGGVDGAAYLSDSGVFYTARSLFVVNGAERDGITVEFNLPHAWQVTTPWQRLGADAARFIVADHDVLANSLLFAGTHREVPVRKGPFEFLLALGGESVVAQEGVFVDMAEGVLDYYVRLMGDVPRLQSQGSQGKPVVVISEYQMTDGEAIGDNISILIEPSGDPMSQHIVRLLFAHEFFHLWNGKSFAPTGDDAEWFKEGFSNYYTLKALHQIGYLTDESFLQMLAGFFYQRYDSDDAVGQEPLTRGDLKHEHWGLIYSGGMLVAIAQDLKIRTATDNEKSLDDLMRRMFDEFGDSAYGLEDIEEALGDLNGVSQKDFFDRHIRGAHRLDIAQFMSLADIETAEEDGRTIFRVNEDPDPAKAAIQRGLFGE